MISIKEYRKAESLEEAWELNQKKANRIIGGMMWLKMSRGRVQTAIDLSGLGLDTIEEREDAFVIGSMVTLRQLETHPGLDAYTDGAVKEALRHIVGVQFRNGATVGGSLFGRYGFSDVLTLFMTLDAEVELYKGGVIPVSVFTEMSCDRNVLVRVIVKKKPEKYYYQSVRNTDTDFPALTCGAALAADGSLRLCFGARPQKAMMLLNRNGVLDGLCAGENSVGRTESGAGDESESHAEVEMESNAGTESESYAGVEMESDVGTESESHAGVEMESNAGIESESYAGVEPERDAGSESENHTGVELKNNAGTRPESVTGVEVRSEDAAVKRAEAIGIYAAANIPTGSNMRGSAAYRSHLVRTLASRAAEHFLTEAL